MNNSNLPTILQRCLDMSDYWSVEFLLSTGGASHWFWVYLLIQDFKNCIQETRNVVLRCAAKHMSISSTVQAGTDRQTDGRTDGQIFWY